MTRLMLTTLSAMTPRPTQRSIPTEPLYRQRSRPCRRLTTLMRPSHPVRHFWPSRNQRFLCSRLRSGLLVERLGMQTRLTPIAFAAASFLAAVRTGPVVRGKRGMSIVAYSCPPSRGAPAPERHHDLNGSESRETCMTTPIAIVVAGALIAVAILVV